MNVLTAFLSYLQWLIPDSAELQVTMADFYHALSEVKPAFGAVTETLESYRSKGMINFGARMQKLMGTCNKLVRQVIVSLQTPSE